MNFVIFGQGRTGSNLLVSLLQSHPQVQCDYEILGGDFIWHLGPFRVRSLAHRLARRYPVPYLMWVSSRSTKAAYGFKLLFGHVESPQHTISHLNRQNWQIIHIQRRCLFDAAISRSVAFVTHHFGEYAPSTHMDGLCIEIPPSKLIRQVQHCIKIRRGELLALTGIPHISVTYEVDLCSEIDRNRICSVIFNALHVEPYQVSTARERSWNRPYRELVTNYAELHELMQSEQGMEWQAAWDILFEDE